MADTASTSEWNASPLRVVARWIPVFDAGGRARLEMTWAVPEVAVALVASDGTGTAA
jgi:hypothetical protein